MKAVKFNFGEDFDAQNQDQAELEALALEERLRKTEESAFEKGQASGRAEASEDNARELTAIMARAADQINALINQRAELEDRLEREAVQLALSMARKLAAAALEMHPHAEIETLISECMKACREQPRIAVRLSLKQCEPLAEKIEQQKQSSGFAGEVIVIGDEEILDGDCLVEWADGGAERRSAQVAEAIETLVQSFVMKPPVTETPEAPERIAADEQSTDSPDEDRPTADEAAAEMTDRPPRDNRNEAPGDEAPTMEQPGAA